MILRAPDEPTGLKNNPTSPTAEPLPLADTSVGRVLNLVEQVVARYQIEAMRGLLAITRTALSEHEIPLAVLGRFKAGKSSFLNHFLDRELLPIGVVPVTATVTEIRYGARDRAVVSSLDGTKREVPLAEIPDYVSETKNPENVRGVGSITVELRDLSRFAGLRFVDTPGLESAQAHNTETSLDWLPNVGLALVTVSVDPPLSRRDIELLQTLREYTPKIAILLTKADLLNDEELSEVLSFVRSQLEKHLGAAPPVFPIRSDRASSGFACNWSTLS